MTRADFYVLTESSLQAQQQFICRLIEKIYGLGKTIQLQVKDQSQAMHWDELLWSFREDSFIPHEIAADGTDSPIEIRWEGASSTPRDVFFNLSDSIPASAWESSRIVEIVTPQNRDDARKRYQTYRDRGLELHKHDS